MNYFNMDPKLFFSKQYHKVCMHKSKYCYSVIDFVIQYTYGNKYREGLSCEISQDDMRKFIDIQNFEPTVKTVFYFYKNHFEVVNTDKDGKSSGFDFDKSYPYVIKHYKCTEEDRKIIKRKLKDNGWELSKREIFPYESDHR